VLSEYPISTVTALSKAATINRLYDTVALSGAMAAGCVHAVEAGFSGKQPKALRNYQNGMLKEIKKLKSRGQGQKADAQTLLSGFGSIGAKTEKRRGRHQD
jgi:hypothetical protein